MKTYLASRLPVDLAYTSILLYIPSCMGCALTVITLVDVAHFPMSLPLDTTSADLMAQRAYPFGIQPRSFLYVICTR